jgi:hypothetical protein
MINNILHVWWVKDQQMHHSFNVLVLNILLHVSAFQNAIIRVFNINMLRLCPMTWKAEKDGSCILWQRRNPDPYAVCHSIQLPSFSAFHGIGHHLSMFILNSLMMAFWNAETCRSTLGTNTLNEWCICRSFTHHKKTQGLKCKILHIFFYSSKTPVSLGLHIVEVSRSHSDTPHSVGLLWTSDQSVAETPNMTTHNTHNKQISITPAGFEPAIPASQRSQTHNLDRAATRTGTNNSYFYYNKLNFHYICG